MDYFQNLSRIMDYSDPPNRASYACIELTLKRNGRLISKFYIIVVICLYSTGGHKPKPGAVYSPPHPQTANQSANH